MITVSKLCLGTVQFGMKYGINNQNGQPSEESCFGMLDAALEQGIDTIDTARAYGTAEIVVGKYLEYRRCQNKVRLISKLRPNVIDPEEKDIYSIIRGELEGSLDRLHVSRLQGYLLHTPEYVYNDEIVDTLSKLKEEGLIENIGVSIYNMEEGFEAIRRGMDYVQLPYSVLDQRGEQSGFIEAAKNAGMTVFTRSAFLQGLFMMERERIPEHLGHALPYLEHFDRLVKQYRRDKVELLLQFVKALKGIDYLVFGVDNVQQLQEDIKAFETGTFIGDELLRELKDYYRQVDDSIILPSLWSNGKKRTLYKEIG